MAQRRLKKACDVFSKTAVLATTITKEHARTSVLTFTRNPQQWRPCTACPRWSPPQPCPCTPPTRKSRRRPPKWSGHAQILPLRTRFAIVPRPRAASHARARARARARAPLWCGGRACLALRAARLPARAPRRGSYRPACAATRALGDDHRQPRAPPLKTCLRRSPFKGLFPCRSVLLWVRPCQPAGRGPQRWVLVFAPGRGDLCWHPGPTPDRRGGHAGPKPKPKPRHRHRPGGCLAWTPLA